MKKYSVTLIIAAVCALLTWALESSSTFQAYGLKTLDIQFAIAANPKKADPRIIMIDVDQASIDHFEKDNISFPWPRSLYNPLIEYCKAGGAKAIMFDILFNDISPYGEEVDREFAAAMAKAGNVYLAAAFTLEGETDKAIAERFGAPSLGVAPETILRRGVSAPIGRLLDSTAGIGSVTFKPDPDGVYRRILPVISYGGRMIPALYLAPLASKGKPVEFGDRSLTIGGTTIPIGDDSNAMVNFHGPRGTYARYSAAGVITSALLEGSQTPSVSKDVFKDAYVIVGYTAQGLFDLKATPLSAVSPGAEIYAAALDNTLNDDYITPLPKWALASLVFALALAVSFGVAISKNTLVSIVPFFAVTLIASGIAVTAFKSAIWVNGFTLFTGVALSFVSSGVWKYSVEGRQRRFIQKAMSLYVSPKLVSQIIDDPSMLRLGGAKREITIFFSDLVGFTSLSEKTEAQALVKILNEYTTLMEEVITSLDGTVDKYIGDAVMAFWGAPVDQPDHAYLACSAALESLRRLGEFRDDLVRRGLPEIDMRIGVNTGMAVVGNMGSERRFNYTALGDPVNEASRLEGINKAYGTRIIVAEPTWIAVSDRIFGRMVDFMKVKGKEIPSRIYEVMALRGMETQSHKTVKAVYEKAFAEYQSRRWDEAITLAEGLIADYSDGPSKTLVKRAKGYKANPPSSDWDGSFAHTDK
ncbi:MAG: adenylate/guanylate cyclase domain-containing protein [Nitrospinae bacterium]|nr:adenylate/guanylate cyclase domain-containing protein [Nitrospinota bacterium]